jgi:gas vesicle protein
MKAKRIMRKEPLAALFVGGLVGAGVGMMVTRKSGKEVRERIGKFAGDANEAVRDYTRQGKARVIDLAERGKDYVRGRKTLVTTTFAAGKEAYVKERGRLRRRG